LISRTLVLAQSVKKMKLGRFGFGFFILFISYIYFGALVLLCHLFFIGKHRITR